MEQLNKVELVGIVGNVRVSRAGDGRIARITLATSHIYTPADESPVIETTWHNIDAIEDGDRIKDVEAIKTGDKLRVLGRIRNIRVYDEYGKPYASISIIANSVEVINE